MQEPTGYRRVWQYLAILISSLTIIFWGIEASPAARADTLRPLANGNQHVTIMVLDMSGSMQDTDPDRLRCTAANAYIDLSGPGDLIGVVNLDSGPSSLIISPPVEMSTQAARKGLRDTIQSKTNGCSPDGGTPTYDAMNQALSMLNTATQNGQIPGSMILLTDGDPEPNPQGQINDIKNNLLPNFKQHGWPVDVVALDPQDQSGIDFHGFLNDIANATGGHFYDDSHGIVPGVSPLNIAPFFVDIFATRNKRTPGPTIPPTDLSGGVQARDFTLGDLADHMDIIVVKDQPGTQVTLLDPNRAQVTSGPNIFVTTDPHYAIYSIDGPQSGTWEVDVSGSGKFLVDTLISSTLKMSITQPIPSSPVFPLGQPFTVSAMLSSQGVVVTNGYTVSGKIVYKGDTQGKQPYSQIITLSDPNGTGTYMATVTLPTNAPAGTYDLTACASRTSSAAIVCDSISLRLSLFPMPSLLNASGTAADPVQAPVVQFDRGLQLLYGWPNGIVRWLSGGPLNRLPATTSANIPGQVLLNGQPYCDATVKGVAQPVNGGPGVDIAILNSGCGKFLVQFPSAANGTYKLTFQTSGSFKDSHGDFGTTSHSAIVTITSATLPQELRAWLWTLVLYPFEIFLLISIIRSRIFINRMLPATYQIKGTRNAEGTLEPRTSWFWALMQRNIQPSRLAFQVRGMDVRTDRQGQVEVRRSRWPFNQGSGDWRADGNPLPRRFTKVEEVTYGSSTYIFNRRSRNASRGSAELAPVTAAKSYQAPIRANSPPTSTRGKTISSRGGGRPGAPPPRLGAPPPKR